MNDKELMEEHLLVEKGICDLYMHGALEATTAEVHNEFKNALNESLNIQNKIYNLMSAKGWYQTTPAEQTRNCSGKTKVLFWLLNI